MKSFVESFNTLIQDLEVAVAAEGGDKTEHDKAQEQRVQLATEAESTLVELEAKVGI